MDDSWDTASAAGRHLWPANWSEQDAGGAERGRRRKKAKEPSDVSPETQLYQRRLRRENERLRSLNMACTLMSVTSLTPGCGTGLLLTKYHRLSQLVRYIAFLEDATSALVKELGVRLNFDWDPVTRHIRRLRYQAQSAGASGHFSSDEAEEVNKLLETMSAGESQPVAGGGGGGSGSWSNRRAVPGNCSSAAASTDDAGRVPTVTVRHLSE